MLATTQEWMTSVFLHLSKCLTPHCVTSHNDHVIYTENNASDHLVAVSIQTAT